MQKILLTALIAGCLAGLLVFAIQSFKLTPLILQAEIYEEADAIKQAASPETGMHAHQHAEDAC